jgi:hypothetical protein
MQDSKLVKKVRKKIPRHKGIDIDSPLQNIMQSHLKSSWSVVRWDIAASNKLLILATINTPLGSTLLNEMRFCSSEDN